MKETVCQFGPDSKLLGILTTPDKDKAVAGAPVAVILNAGIVHRIGPFRLHVDLARLLAERGFCTFRMDLSGIGDSPPRQGKLNFDDSRAVMDVTDALDFLGDTMDTKQFVVLGLCSGAYNGHQVSVKDSRVVGSVFMDGIVFPTIGYYVRHHLFRLFRYRFWRNMLKRRLFGGERVDESVGETLAEDEFFGDGLDQHTVSKELKGMLGRGVRMLFLYTDGYNNICGRSQFKEMYGLRPDDDQLQVEYYPNSEHTYRLIENRRIACSRVANWFEDQFSVATIVPNCVFTSQENG